MRLLYALIAMFALLATSLAPVAAKHDHATPDAEHSDHGDHSEHGDHGDPGDMHGSENLSMGAFYFTVTNNGDQADTLLAIETDMAETVEIHDVEMEDSVMKMVPQHDGVEIPAGETLVLEPGSYHVMMIGITESLIDGEEFTATLQFENAGDVEITVPIYAVEPEEGEFGESVEIGDIEVSNIWARQAPKIDGMATPMATPDATPGH